jgi:hypothetical protein
VLGAVDDVLDRYRDHLPLSVRQVFYVLLGEGIVDKTEQDYKRLCEYLAMARRAGRIAWTVIRDDTQIAVSAPTAYTGPTDFWDQVAAAATTYRLDRQTGQPVVLELWCETAGMVPQLARIGADFGISCYSGGGFDGLTGKHDAAVRAAARTMPTGFCTSATAIPAGSTCSPRWPRTCARSPQPRARWSSSSG